MNYHEMILEDMFGNRVVEVRRETDSFDRFLEELANFEFVEPAPPKIVNHYHYHNANAQKPKHRKKKSFDIKRKINEFIVQQSKRGYRFLRNSYEVRGEVEVILRNDHTGKEISRVFSYC